MVPAFPRVSQFDETLIVLGKLDGRILPAFSINLPERFCPRIDGTISKYIIRNMATSTSFRNYLLTWPPNTG